ncbi:hypothetical protein ACWENQ_02985 [Nonomuraea sp. NPDC004354]
MLRPRRPGNPRPQHPEASRANSLPFIPASDTAPADDPSSSQVAEPNGSRHSAPEPVAT